jgi:myo-inositol-1(or 4)-monophosphatase
VHRASELLRAAVGNVGRVWTKTALTDLVTEWDVRAEEVIRTALAEMSPGVPILGEEAGRSEGSSASELWLVDPIDGTVNFAHGLPLFAVSLALEQDGSPIAGVVAAPAIGWEFHAHAGGGAFLDARPIRVSEVASLDQAMLATGFPYDRAVSGHNFAEWEHFQRRAGACRRLGAASLDLAMVAAGWFDGYWESRLSPWDLSAGALLVSEAGGTVTDIDGGRFVSAGGNAIASNGRIHGALVADLAALRHRKQ